MVHIVESDWVAHAYESIYVYIYVTNNENKSICNRWVWTIYILQQLCNQTFVSLCQSLVLAALQIYRMYEYAYVYNNVDKIWNKTNSSHVLTF